MWEKISSLEHHSPERLAERRKRGHYRVLLIHAFLFCILFAAVICGLWQPPVRISRVVIYGGSQSIASIATEEMRGSYLGIIPRDSTFFLPEARIRADVIAAYPNIAALSIFRDGLTGISIKINDRVAVARWCGASPASLVGTSTVSVGTSQCYFFDAVGLIFSSADAMMPVNPFIVYESLAENAPASSPVGATLPNAEKFPAVFDFARKFSALGSPVMTIVFRNDEIDYYLKSGTRVTYVLGNEQYATTALLSGSKSINLSDGSLEYIDLRFDGKVYLKKK